MNDRETVILKIKELQASSQHAEVLIKYRWNKYESDAAILLALSDTYRYLNEWKELKLLCRSLIEHDVESFMPWAYFGLAEAEYYMGDLNSALESVTATIELKDDLYWGKLLRANIYLDLNDVENCLSECERAKELNSESSTLYDLYLRIFEKTGREVPGLKSLTFEQLSIEQVNRLQTVFDSKFYSRTNSDVESENALQHYINSGWKANADPSADFSTKSYIEDYYLEENQGICPLIHFVYRGADQGVVTRSSDYQLCTAVVMVKNEGDIIEAFSSHLMALFDNIIFVDHQSNDGTRQFLDALESSEKKVSVFELKEQSYIQALLMNHVLRTNETVSESDWVFILDCDEFLPFNDKSDFSNYLASKLEEQILFFPWKNIIPVPYWEDVVEISANQDYLMPDEYSVYGKVAFRTSVLEDENVWLAQGNHTLLNHKDGVALPAHFTDMPLYHIPVRSKKQFTLKLNQGVSSYKALGQDRDKLEGSHWFKILDKVRTTGLSDGILNRVVLEYGDHQKWDEISTDEVIDCGYSKVNLNIVNPETANKFESKLSFSELILQTGLADQSETAFAGPISSLSTLDNNTIVRAGNESITLILSKETELDEELYSELSDKEYLYNFLRPSYWDIELLTPTAWSGHIPFLFCIVSLAKPRSYAELGTHFGASFFAYCQACVRREIVSTPVAIDCWEGDDHTGAYEESVFTQFRHHYNKYGDFAKYLRMYFDEAVEYFEDGSLDLLHIDGLHTYEAVKHDFYTWKEKMSDQGIVLFHDTNVHERDFGVWQFWAELRQDYPTIEFKHSHGLGVAYVGEKKKKDVARLFDVLKDPAELAFVQHHLESISQSKARLALNQYEIDELRSIEGRYYELTDDNVKLKQKLNAIASERKNLSEMLKETMKVPVSSADIIE